MMKESKPTITEESVRYQALTRLTKIALDLASTRDLNKESNNLILATKIRLWLKALDYKKYLTRAQRDKLLYALIDISNIYSLPKSPVLNSFSKPDDLINTSVIVTR
jgi:hypothetical protein